MSVRSIVHNATRARPALACLTAIAGLLAAACGNSASVCNSGNTAATDPQPGDVVVTYDDDDPRLKAAADEARRRWPELVNFFRRGEPSQVCYAKAGFAAPDGSREYLWLRITELTNSAVTGRVNSSPRHATSVTQGQTVTIPAAEVCDWMVHEYRVIAGDFQARILEQDQHTRASP